MIDVAVYSFQFVPSIFTLFCRACLIQSQQLMALVTQCDLIFQGAACLLSDALHGLSFPLRLGQANSLCIIKWSVGFMIGFGINKLELCTLYWLVRSTYNSIACQFNTFAMKDIVFILKLPQFERESLNCVNSATWHLIWSQML